jgi:outer membrane receptor protein involved in Fe transport
MPPAPLRLLSVPAACAGALLLAAAATPAQTAATQTGVRDAEALPAISVPAHYDNAVGTSDAASQGLIHRSLLDSRPALRPGEVLEFVPGVIVTQHSGDGKANQYFLRGFNLDHGTDFATTVDGLPVNMPTHGHGQGYSDLNFLIPELVERIAYRKGPYFAQTGNFSAAGSADIAYRRMLDAPFAALTLGEHGYRRAVLGGSTTLAPGLDLLAAIEAMGHDGPWTTPQGLERYNGVLKLSSGTRAQGWSASLMGYSGHWTSTDQVPHRAIDDGRIGRFDAIDPTDGGRTQRLSAAAEWHRHEAGGGWQVAGYAMRYGLQLWSNFTYALERPEGDQFEQQDGRQVYGLSAVRDWTHTLAGRPSRTEAGWQLRHDRIRVGLFDTAARERVATTREDQVRETAHGLYLSNDTVWLPWLRTVAGLRADHHRTDVDSDLEANSGQASATRLSPKLSAVFGPWARTELFVNAGRGLHSNDARGTTARIDPKSGDALQPVPPLVMGTGYELGLRSEAVRGLQSSLALWQLELDSELVYVGDAGNTEPNRASRRWGVEWNNRYAPVPWLLLDADLAWTHARFSQDAPEGRRIPGAVESVASVALTLHDLGPWSASLQLRYLGPRPLVEDNSVRAASTLLANLRLGWQMTPRWSLTLDVFNLFDRRVNDIEYFYESRLAGEADAVSDRHLHPAEPRTARVTLKATF